MAKSHASASPHPPSGRCASSTQTLAPTHPNKPKSILKPTPSHQIRSDLRNEASTVSDSTHELLSSPSPMNDSSYLASPISTLVYSNQPHALEHISANDLREAYTTLLARLRSHTHLLEAVNPPAPALDAIRRKARTVTDVLLRDMGRALVDPFDALAGYGGSDPSGSQLNLTELQKCTASDSAALCHHSLLLLSYILRYSDMHGCFDGTWNSLHD
jgi:hypothetical protein